MAPISNFRRIVQGFKNHKFDSKAMKVLARERAKVCSKCPYCDPEYKFKKLLGDGESIEEIKKIGCKACGCLLSAKVRQLHSTCPQGRWG